MKSPIAYLGGKSRLVKTIVPMIPEHTCYCEAFAGAAWVLFGKPPSKSEVINDADAELVTFWRVIQNHYQPFLDLFRFAIVSRRIFQWENMKRPETLTDLQRAVRYFYLQRNSFGGKTVGRTFGTSATAAPNLNLSTMESDLLAVHWRLAAVTIECLDALDCVRRYDRAETFFYLDPPYYGTAGYAVPWPASRYQDLADLLATISGKFILSINDHQEIRRIFKRFTLRAISTTYSVRNGRDLAAGRSAPRSELLIHNLNPKRSFRAVS